MSVELKSQLIAFVKRIGPWSGVRYLRNVGVPFELAHEVMLGIPPRR